MFSDSKFDAVHEDPEQNSGVNWFCMLEQFVVALLYLSIMFIEPIVAYILSLKLCMKEPETGAPAEASPENTNDNFQNTQHIVNIPIETAQLDSVNVGNDTIEPENEDVNEVVIENANDHENNHENVHESDNNNEQTPDEASYEIVPEGNNKQPDDAQEPHAEENQQQNEEANETDQLMAPPTTENHAKVGERSTDERKDSDV
jgi:hypothetical protein